MTFLLKNQNKKKGKKLKTRLKYGFTHVIYRMPKRTPFAAATAVQQIWICSLTFQKPECFRFLGCCLSDIFETRYANNLCREYTHAGLCELGPSQKQNES